MDTIYSRGSSCLEFCKINSSSHWQSEIQRVQEFHKILWLLFKCNSQLVGTFSFVSYKQIAPETIKNQSSKLLLNLCWLTLRCFNWVLLMRSIQNCFPCLFQHQTFWLKSRFFHYEKFVNIIYILVQCAHRCRWCTHTAVCQFPLPGSQSLLEFLMRIF